MDVIGGNFVTNRVVQGNALRNKGLYPFLRRFSGFEVIDEGRKSLPTASGLRRENHLIVSGF